MEQYLENLQQARRYDSATGTWVADPQLNGLSQALSPGGGVNLTGYSLGGHLANVFTLLHEDVVKHAYIFNAAGLGVLDGLNPTLTGFADLLRRKLEMYRAVVFGSAEDRNRMVQTGDVIPGVTLSGEQRAALSKAITDDLILPRDPTRAYTSAIHAWMRELLFQGGSRIRVRPGSMGADLGAVCSGHGTTKFMTGYSALRAWLQRVTRTTDIVVGTVLANRRQSQWQDVVGYFANPVALRMNLSDVDTGEQLLCRARRIVCDAYDHQDVPFERVIGALKGRRAADSPHVFNVMIVWEDNPLSELRLDGLSVRHVPIDDVAVELDLTLLVVNGVEGLELVMLYDRALFDGATVDRMLAQIEIILKGLIENPVKLGIDALDGLADTLHARADFQSALLWHPQEEGLEILARDRNRPVGDEGKVAGRLRQHGQGQERSEQDGDCFHAERSINK